MNQVVVSFVHVYVPTAADPGGGGGGALGARAPPHGGLLPLNAWKVGPPPRKIEMVYVPHSNEPDNRCLLELAMLLSS